MTQKVDELACKDADGFNSLGAQVLSKLYSRRTSIRLHSASLIPAEEKT